MTDGWDLLPLEDLVAVLMDRRGVTPIKLGSDFQSAGHRVISAKLIKNGRVELSADQPRFVNESIYRKWMPGPLLADDVILTSEAPIGEVAYISKSHSWCLGQRLFGIRTKKDKLHGRFLYYALKSDSVRDEMLSRATGTTAQGIRQSELRRIRIPLPPLSEQRAIASILGTLDDKIELNRQMNRTLEQMAQALFQSWFVDFDPVWAKKEGRQPVGMDADTAALFPDEFEESELGLIPKGWEVEAFSSNIDILSGGTPVTKVPEYWNGKIPWVSIVDTAPGPYIINTKKTVTPLGVAESSTTILPAETVVITARGTVGQTVLMAYPMAMNQSCYGLRGKKNVGQLYLLHQTRNLIERLKSNVHGSVFDTITRDTFNSLTVVLPPKFLMQSYEQFVRPMFNLIRSNEEQTVTLGHLRDTLLPKLLSGELRVPITAEDVLTQEVTSHGA